MMHQFNRKEIEEKWNSKWEEDRVYKTQSEPGMKKYYSLDMFPYPSGAGLHVGHPLGYIASDIISRFKRLQGYNVLHAMGFDSFGLPAEQYAIETGQHPAVTTEKNIKTFNAQIRKMGLSLDIDREFRTSDKEYYKWTQLIFLKLFNSWFDTHSNSAKSIDELLILFDKNGSNNTYACVTDASICFSAEEWNAYNEETRSKVLMNYRLAYLSEATVNWCPILGTVLANDEVLNGLSERGGHPIEKRKMQQWMLRITAYADRLLSNLNKLDWPNSLKEMQRNWIGYSSGMSIAFKVHGSQNSIEVFTSKPETIFGATFICISPEYKYIKDIVKNEHTKNYLRLLDTFNKSSERERISDQKNVSGVFTGNYAINPVTQKLIPIWVGNYVISDYGSGAIMGVPYGDERDLAFATKYNLECIEIIDKNTNLFKNSDIINGLNSTEARDKTCAILSQKKLADSKINYKMRDAIFGRQRYWGEPIPIYFDSNNIPQGVDEDDLPIILPEIDQYLPTSDAKPPLGRATNWKYKDKYDFELTTMPGWAGSSWYFLRYMSPTNDDSFVDPDDSKYWNSVDLYMGGSEHATGHLLYSRFWNLFLYDMDLLSFDEPFKKIVNQGMIQGRSSLAYRIKGENTFVSSDIANKYDVDKVHVDIALIDKNDKLDIEAFKQWRGDLKDSKFILNNNSFYCDWRVEKMSKSKYNIVNPDLIIEIYGADVFRLYEMFLGPLTQSKPWSLSGIEGIERYISKVWRLFFDLEGKLLVTDDSPTLHELQTLHKMLNKVSVDIEKLSFNTAITAMMIFTNELIKLNCHKKEILKPFIIAFSPFAVYLCQEVWERVFNMEGYIINSKYPKVIKEYLYSPSKLYPISVNGKVREKMEFNLTDNEELIKREVLKSPKIMNWTVDKEIKKFIYVPNKIINIVI
jgi:leucyl-tRNA synthetase